MIINAVSLFLLPQLLKKSTYIISLSASFGVLMILLIGAYSATKIFTSNREKQQIETAIVEKTPNDKELYDSVRTIMVQKNYAVADELITYANNSLGAGEHTASEVAVRIDEIITGKVTIEPVPAAPTHKMPMGISRDSFDLIFITFISLLIVVILGLFIQLAHLMVDMVIGFHTTYNAANLARNPIKFAIENRDTIKSIFTYGFFLGSFIMFYGVVFKMKI